MPFCERNVRRSFAVRSRMSMRASSVSGTSLLQDVRLHCTPIMTSVSRASHVSSAWPSQCAPGVAPG